MSKYKLRDTVWFLQGHKAITGVIVNIRSESSVIDQDHPRYKETEDKLSVVYKIRRDDDEGTHVSCSEVDVFLTKEELIASL